MELRPQSPHSRPPPPPLACTSQSSPGRCVWGSCRPGAPDPAQKALHAARTCRRVLCTDRHHPAHLCAAVPPSRAVSVLPESPVSLLQEGSPWQRSFSLSFFFWFVFFKRLKASCYASPRHMRGSTCFPHTAAPHLRPQPCKVLESKHQWIRVRTFQMAGLRRWTRLPRKLEHSLPSRSCAASLSLRRLGGCCFSPASSPKVSPRVREKQGRAEARGSGACLRA